MCEDMRPFHAIDCEGLLDLCTSAMEFGQRNPKAKREDLAEAMPTRNTTKSTVIEMSMECKEKIRKILAEARNIGGFAATCDIWIDDHMHNTYICVVVHVNLISSEGIKIHRLVIHTSNIEEKVKTKKVIVHHILEIFDEYDFDGNDVKKYETFVTDRGGNIKYGLKDAGSERLSCYDHLIHNLLSSMLDVPELKTMVQDASKFFLCQK